MGVIVRSFAKINFGLCIGARRADGFHELRTIYQTVALHDLIRIEVVRGRGIEIVCEDSRVPRDETNTCWRAAELAMPSLRARGRVVISIDKRLPVRGGLGAASGNAVAVLLGLERAVKKQLSPAARLKIAASVGSDLPLFLVGGTVLGVGRGEEVYPVADLPSAVCVVAMPSVGVSTPEAFRDWDLLTSGAKARINSAGTAALKRVLHPKAESKTEAEATKPTAEPPARSPAEPPAKSPAEPSAEPNISSLAGSRGPGAGQLTLPDSSDRIDLFGRRVSGWLSSDLSGVPGSSGRGRAGNPLLDLVRTGIENDFEQVVFPKYPELREVKRVLEGAGAYYASLSGSGSALYGLFGSQAAAKKAVARLSKIGTPSVVTKTLRRQQYWKKWLVRDF